MLALALGGCSAPDREQIVARVNGAPILADEIDLALRQQGAADDGVARRRLVEKIVVEELLAQQFLRSTPGSADVESSAVTAARREMLARRYIADLIAGVPAPTAAEVSAFYQANPALFAHRQAFRLRQLDISVPPGREAELRERIAAAASVEALAQWLRQQGLAFTSTEAERTSDELPNETTARLAAMKDGEVALVPSAVGLRVIQLLKARSAALGEEAAQPLIRQRLWMEKRTAAVDTEVRRLTELAAISIGEGGARQAPGMSGLNPIGRLLFSPEAAGEAR